MKQYLISTLLASCSLLIITSCKPHQRPGGYSGGGGEIPTAEEVNEHIDRLTRPEDNACGDVRTDTRKILKYPYISASGKNRWEDDYSENISKQFDKDYMAPLKSQKIDEGDLSMLGCKGYNYASEKEKKQFWMIFLSALSKTESDFNPNEAYYEEDHTVSTGLLQIDGASANRWCGKLGNELHKNSFSDHDMKDPKMNLQCGMIIMQKQMQGAPSPEDGHKLRPELIGRLFTPRAFYWAPLSDKNPGSQNNVIKWFRVHAQQQLKFCNPTNPIDGHVAELNSKYKEMDCKGIQNKNEKESCEKVKNAKLEEDQTDPTIGEKPTDSTCKRIENGERANGKDENLPKATEDQSGSSTSQK